LCTVPPTHMDVESAGKHGGGGAGGAPKKAVCVHPGCTTNATHKHDGSVVSTVGVQRGACIRAAPPKQRRADSARSMVGVQRLCARFRLAPTKQSRTLQQAPFGCGLCHAGVDLRTSPKQTTCLTVFPKEVYSGIPPAILKATGAWQACLGAHGRRVTRSTT